MGSNLTEGFVAQNFKIWVISRKSEKACPEEKARKSEKISRKTGTLGSKAPEHGHCFQREGETPEPKVPVTGIHGEIDVHFDM